MSWRIIVADVFDGLAQLDAGSVQCAVTSPPYWGLRDYGQAGQIGLEPTPQAYVARMVEVFREVRRVLADDGVLWLNLGDSYSSGGRKTQVAPTLRTNGHDEASGKAEYLNGFAVRPGVVEGLSGKQLIGIPWRVAFALQEDGWWLRQDIIWHKPNPMPESVADRCTKAHEYLFMLTKSARYYFDAEAIAEPASEALAPADASGSTISGGGYGRSVLGEAIPEKERRTDKQRGHSRRHAGFNARWDAKERAEQCSGTRNKRDAWTIATKPFQGAHFATFPPELPRLCIAAGSRPGDTVLDPFCGAGTTGLVADRLGRNFVGVEINPTYAEMARERITADAPLFSSPDTAANRR